MNRSKKKPDWEHFLFIAGIALVRQFDGSTQQAIEIQQDVDEKSEHLLPIGTDKLDPPESVDNLCCPQGTYFHYDFNQSC